MTRDEALAKARIVKHSRLTAKEKAFAEEFVKSRNGTASALKVYDTNSPGVAANIASENLTKPKIRAEIERLFKANDLELTEVLSIHARNARQEKHLPTSQKAVTDYYELIGLKPDSKGDGGVKIAFIIEK